MEKGRRGFGFTSEEQKNEVGSHMTSTTTSALEFNRVETSFPVSLSPSHISFPSKDTNPTHLKQETWMTTAPSYTSPAF